MEKQDYHILKNQKGFTLIEIIAVLVIMGILAAVAVPKFFDLAADAEGKAYSAAGAELQARINQNFAQQLLNKNGACSDAISSMDASEIFTSLGESFTVDPPRTSLTGVGAAFSVTIKNTDFDSTTAESYTLTMPDCGTL